MALVVVVLSGLFGALAALVALIGFDASLSQALVLYLVSSIVPAALIMAAAYLHMQVFGSAEEMPAQETAASRIRN